MTTIVNMHKAKTALSDLVARAEAGEEIVIARRNMPVVRLTPVVAKAQGPWVPGAYAHLADTAPSNLFLEPMGEDELREWEDGHPDDPLK